MSLDASLMAYTMVVTRATVLEQDETKQCGEESFVGSFLVTLLFIPFSIYFGVVFLIFALECYQFVIVWNLVSRTRSHHSNNHLPSMTPSNFNLFRVWNHRYHSNTGINIDIDIDTQDAPVPSKEDVAVHVQQQLDVWTFQNNDKQHHTKTTTCSICLSEFQPNETVATIRECHCGSNNSNLFHHQCLTQWLEEQPSCPYCRMNLLPQAPPDASSPITESLEIASLQVEHYLCNALTVFGELVSSYTY